MVNLCLSIILFCLTILCISMVGALVLLVVSLIKEWWEDR